MKNGKKINNRETCKVFDSKNKHSSKEERIIAGNSKVEKHCDKQLSNFIKFPKNYKNFFEKFDYRIRPLI